MDKKIRIEFLEKWEKYFGKAELPITFYFSDKYDNALKMKHSKSCSCLIGELAQVRKGKSVTYNINSISCAGAKRYTGFSLDIMPGFEYFLFHGIPGNIEGERYKRNPEIVKEIQKNFVPLKPGSENIIFKRWDKLEETDNPDVVIFFANPDVLSGLFTLANFDVDVQSGIITPFSAGCGSIIQYPYLEKNSPHPKYVLGMFDPSARPGVPKDSLSFAIPYNRFLQLMDYMDECFLITKTWQKVKARINN